MERIFLVKNLNFTLNLPMVLLNYIHTGLHQSIESHMEFLHQMVFYLITKAQEEVKLLLQEKSQDFWQRKNLEVKMYCI